MVLKKQFILVYKNGVIAIADYDNHGECMLGRGFEGAEFDSAEELDDYIELKKLTPFDEAIETMICIMDGEEVDIRIHIFDDNVTLVKKENIV